jgi:hypothetical protein
MLTTLGWPPPGEAAPRAKTIRYSVGWLGLEPSKRTAQRFRNVVEATLDDPRGWSLNGRIRFREGRGSAFRITLASPGAVAGFAGCSSAWSCRAGHFVLINKMRWDRASGAYPGRSRLQAYRQLVINHEVGHALGFGHAYCGRRGSAAPAMQQQSKGLNGCDANPWPLRWERRILARRYAVRLGRPRARLVMGESVGGIRIGDSRRAVIARLGDPQRRRRHRHARMSGATTIDDYPAYFRLNVGYARGRVVSVTTRSTSDRSVRGLGVGTPLRRLRRATCSTRSNGLMECVVGRAQRRGDTPTTFVVRARRVIAVKVERLPTAVPPSSDAPAP